MMLIASFGGESPTGTAVCEGEFTCSSESCPSCRICSSDPPNVDTEVNCGVQSVEDPPAADQTHKLDVKCSEIYIEIGATTTNPYGCDDSANIVNDLRCNGDALECTELSPAEVSISSTDTNTRCSPPVIRPIVKRPTAPGTAVQNGRRGSRSFLRRSISESHYVPSIPESTRRAKDRARHSFSSYDSFGGKYSNAEVIIQNFINEFALGKPNNERNSLHNGKTTASNRSGGLTNALIDSAKLSIIEEYKNLKKYNSSVNCDNTAEDYRPDHFVQRKISEKVARNLRDDVIKECVESPVSAELEEEPLQGEMPSPISSLTDSSEHGSIASIYVSRAPPVWVADSEDTLCLSELQADGEGIKPDTGSPPDRLQSWKNILALKKNLRKSDCPPENTATPDETCTSSSSTSNRTGLSSDLILLQSSCSCLENNCICSFDRLSSKCTQLAVNRSELLSNAIILTEENASFDLSITEDGQQRSKLSSTREGIDNVVGNTPRNDSQKYQKSGTIIDNLPLSEDTDAFMKCAHRDKSKCDVDTDDYYESDGCEGDCDFCRTKASEGGDNTSDVHIKATSFHRYKGVKTNGSLKSLREVNEVRRSPPFVDVSHLMKKPFSKLELRAIQEYNGVSSDQHQSEDECSCDDSICDLSSSWRFGLSRDPEGSDTTLKSQTSENSSRPPHDGEVSIVKANSLPNQCKRKFDTATLDMTTEEGIHGIRRPPLPPRDKLRTSLSSSPPNCFLSQGLRPAMGLQGLQQRGSPKQLSLSVTNTAPKQVETRSPSNPNLPFGYTTTNPFFGPDNTAGCAPSSPRTNTRSGALVYRNFSISDDEGGDGGRRQVTITRHDSNPKGTSDQTLTSTTSSVDPCWISWKLSVLLKTVEEVGSRLAENEKAIAELGPVPQDQSLSDQFINNVRKLREKLPDLQRGIDDVNDQAARFAIHNVPLTPGNSAALHDLNNRWKNMETTVSDWWRTVAGRSRDITPLTPAQLAASVNPPWERATAASKVPYFINHAQETTHWDHPEMIQQIDSLCEFNHIKFSAYRTASKLRTLQKKLALDLAKLQMVADVFDEHGLRGQNDRLIDVNDMIVVLSTLYGRIVAEYPDVNASASTDLCLNWLLNVYDSQRTGQLRVLSFRVGLICLCRGHLEDKYRYMFRLIADPNRQVDQRKLGLLLHDCVQVPRQLGEVAAFGGSNIEPSVRSCFVKAGKDKDTIEAVHFLSWVQQEPQSLVWLAVLHRVAASERIQHQVKCNICKTYPIIGLRYRCLKCLSFDMCQRCFFDGKSGKSHKITHPMHEYCTATTAGDEMKDFTKALKNKFKSKRSLQKHTKKGYLPVQTVLEGDALESPSPSPSHASHDMHSRLEVYASRLAEVELRANNYSTPDSEDEHGLIAQYCQSLSSCDGTFPVPRSPLQIMASVDADQKDELEQMIRDLEDENRALQAEYDRLKLEQPPDYDDPNGVRSEAEMLAEAKLLREHKGRLEARMSILEDHNRQLEAQLNRLRHLLDQHGGVASPTKNGTLQTRSVTASQLAVDSPAKVNGHSNQGLSGSMYDGLDQMSDYVRPPPPPVSNLGNLFSRAGELEKAVGHLVESMSPGTENGSLNGSSNNVDTVAVNGTSSQVGANNGS